MQLLKKAISRSKLKWFDANCKGIYRTQRIECSEQSGFAIVSQLYPPHMTMFMMAAKSFCQYVTPRRVIIVDDGLTDENRATLSNHIENIEFIRTQDVDTGACPRGACWERIATLSDISEGEMAIQLDSDTLTIARPDEVIACIEEKRAFTLGTKTGKTIVSADEAARFAQQFDSQHVQNVAEKALDRLEDHDRLKYVRGCAGFAGFSQGSLPFKGIEAFSVSMQKILGPEVWHQWGSEQVTSNFMVANAPDAVVLPVDRYPFWKPGLSLADVRMIHFFGTFRFTEGVYTRLAKGVIKNLA